MSNIDEKLKNLSKELNNIKDIDKYQTQRESQFNNKEFRLKKFGKKSFKWYTKRINYYAIGAFLLAKVNQNKYKKTLKNIENKQ